ncbi:MAG: hypothetical protein F6J95_001690 [Leptolyngbya sp. SIO1E4]|nr:hypothetical protein [Leptolyngbya sp. SIO1E4]
MAIRIVNLTRRSLHQKIEQTLEQNFERRYSQAFANPDLRSKLVTYVLSRVNNCYATVELGQEETLDAQSPNSIPQCQQLDSLIRQGIDALLHPPTHSEPGAMAETNDPPAPAAEPSHWFG